MFVCFDRANSTSSVSTGVSIGAIVVALVNVGTHPRRLRNAALVALAACPGVGIGVGVFLWMSFRLRTWAFVRMTMLVTRYRRHLGRAVGEIVRGKTVCKTTINGTRTETNRWDDEKIYEVRNVEY